MTFGEADYYPAGAYNDPRAPWNDNEYETEFEVEIEIYDDEDFVDEDDEDFEPRRETLKILFVDDVPIDERNFYSSDEQVFREQLKEQLIEEFPQLKRLSFDIVKYWAV